LRRGLPFRLAPGERLKVATGVPIALPEHACALIVPRSGLAANHGVAPFPGLADPNFRGELGVTLLNGGATEFVAGAGERIAQLLLLPFWAPALRIVAELAPSPDDRGTSGWASSGRS